MPEILKNALCGVTIVALVGLTVFIHEFGHYLAARLCGLVVDVFSIGFGPSIWKKRHKGIVYKLGWIPFGGYVALPQLDPTGMALIQGQQESEDPARPHPEDAPRERKPGTAPLFRRILGRITGKAAPANPESARVEPEIAQELDAEARCLPPVAKWKRTVVLLAGASGNMIFAVVLAFIIYLSPEPGAKDEGTSTTIGYVAADSAAAAAGLGVGDRILSVNGEPVTSWYEFIRECHLTSGQGDTVTLQVKSGEQVRDVEVATERQGRTRLISGIDKASTCIVHGVIVGSSAEQAGVLPGDKVKEIDSVKVCGVPHLQTLVAEREGRSVPLVVERDGTELMLAVTPKRRDKQQPPLIGIDFGHVGLFGGSVPWMRYRDPFAQIEGDANEMFRVLRAFFSWRKGEAKQAFEALTGPVGIFGLLWQSILAGALIAIGFLRFVNVNLAIINMLPIPVLDGGHIMFTFWEAITGKRPHPKLVNALVNAFAVLLIGMLAFITLRDIGRIIDRRTAARSAVEKQEDPHGDLKEETNGPAPQ